MHGRIESLAKIDLIHLCSRGSSWVDFFLENSLVSCDLWRIFTSHFKVMLSKLKLSICYRSLWLSLRFKLAGIMLLSVSGSLIVQHVVSHMIVMTSHHLNILNAFKSVHSLKRIMPLNIRQLRNGINYWTSGWSSYLPVSKAKPIFYIRVNCRADKVFWVVSKVRLVRRGHLELFEQRVANPEVRMLRVARLRRGSGTECLVYLW